MILRGEILICAFYSNCFESGAKKRKRTEEVKKQQEVKRH